MDYNPDLAKLRIKKADARAAILDEIVNGDAFKFENINITIKKKTYELPPVGEDEERTVVRHFYAVVLLGKQVWLAPRDEKKAADGEKVEKRVITVLRASNGLDKADPKYIQGAVFPETVWFPKSAIFNYKQFLGATKKAAKHPSRFLAEFTVELGKNAQGDIWSKPTLRIARELTDAEAAYVEEFVTAVRERDKKYQVDPEIDDYEAEVMGMEVKPHAAATKPDEEEAVRGTKKKGIEDDDEEDETTSKKKTRAAKPAEEAKAKPAEEAKAKPAPSDDEEDDEDAAVIAAKAGATKPAAPSNVDDDEED